MTDALPDWTRRNCDVMPDAYAPGPMDIPAWLAHHNPRWTGRQGYVSHWGHGVPLGNGDFGALVYGGPENLTFVLGKNDLWLQTGQPSFLPGTGFDDLLALYRRGDREAFAKLIQTEPRRGDGYRPDSLVNGGFLRLHIAEAAAIKDMNQELHLHEGLWTAAFQAEGLDNMWATAPDFTLEAFCSVPDEVLVIRARREGRPMRSFTWRLGREEREGLPPPETDTQGALSWLEQSLGGGGRYAIAILQDGLPVEATATGRSILGECPGAGSEVTWYVALATTRDSADPLDLASERVRRAASKGYARLRADHAAHWANYWKRSWFSCAEPAVEQAYAVSLYLAGSTIRPGKVSPGLQGMWCRENFPPWSADFHGNINIQSLYQSILGTNHAELFEPCAALYAGMRPQCERDTTAFFGCPGVRYPHAGSLDGHELAEPEWFPLAISFAPSAWIARLYNWYFTHTGDVDFLAGTGYPVMRDVARFYRGILEKTGPGPDGRARIEPSIWGEHEATRFEAWGRDSSYDVAAFAAAFEQAIAAASLLGVDDGERAAWREWADRLPPLPADADNIWLYFPEPQPKNRRYTNGSFFHAVFPCERVSLWHGPEALRQQALATWRHCAGEGAPNAWCGGATTTAAVMLGETAWAWESLRKGLVRDGFSNGLGGSMEAGLIQADHGTGFAFGIVAACAFAINGQILLFGGIPPEVDCAFHSLRTGGPALVSASLKKGRVERVAIQALRDGPLCLLNPHPEGAVELVGSDGSRQACARVEHRGIVEWTARAGVVYECRAGVTGP